MAHTTGIVDHYLSEVDEVFATLAKAVDEGSIDVMLEQNHGMRLRG